MAFFYKLYNFCFSLAVGPILDQFYVSSYYVENVDVHEDIHTNKKNMISVEFFSLSYKFVYKFLLPIFPVSVVYWKL